MGPSPDGSNVVWLFEGDAETRRYTLTVHFSSDLGPAEHEAIHRKLYAAAHDWLLGQDLPPDARIQVKVERLAHVDLAAEATRVAVPDPVPVPDTDKTKQGQTG
jgi:hypothetical protein